jgi:zinc protease
LIAEAIYAQDNQATLARWYGGRAHHGPQHRRDIRSWPDRIRAVTAEQVREAAEWLDKKRSVTGYLIGFCAERRRS